MNKGQMLTDTNISADQNETKGKYALDFHENPHYWGLSSSPEI